MSVKTSKTKSFMIMVTVVATVLIGLSVLSSAQDEQQAPICNRMYSLDADFDEGVLVGVEHETVSDQLQLSEESVTLPFIWVPNSNEGTVSKYDTETGDELGRYRTGSIAAGNGNPSRTTVDLDGNVWFGNRSTGTVVKIGLYEAGQCIDKNGNGTIETSLDSNNDGHITGDEILAWGDDECVLCETLLESAGSGPRGMAIDANNDCWAGTFSLSSNKFFHLDGETGAIIVADTIDISTDISPYSSYGAVIDAAGYIWSSSLSNYVLKIDPATNIITKIDLEMSSYGLGIDNNDHLFVAGWGTNKMARIDVVSNDVTYGFQGDLYTRGVAVTGDGDVWAVNSRNGNLTRLENDLTGTIATIDLGASDWGVMSTGAAVDAAGKVWACNYYDGYLHRIDPATNSIDLSVQTPGMDGTGLGKHYSYSDMTGIISRNITTKIGTWTVGFDSNAADTPWGTVSWNSSEPDGTSVTVKVRSSNDGSTWSAWETATNEESLTTTSDGRYLQVEATLQIISGETSPVLYDLTVECANQSPTADPNGPYLSPLEICFDGTGSSDPDGDPLAYDWDFGDGNTGTGATPCHTYAEAGIYDVCLTVNDDMVDSDQVCTSAVIYDPSAGFVTGGGWIDSPACAYKADTSLTGKANFGFVSKYKKGATTPTGQTEFQFQTADLNFHSDSYGWLVVTGSNYAKFKGVGTINGLGNYKFMIWAGDDESDTFRIKIWEEDELGIETVVYDNGFDQPISGGSIVIHTKK